MSSIPIENLYYLFSYAWGHFHAGEEVEVSAGSCPDLENLLAKVLANGIHRLARTGFQRDYLPMLETTPRLRGRIQVAQSYRHMTHRAGKMICEFDELSHDIPANQILRAVARRLLRAETLTQENCHQLRLAIALLPQTREIAVTDSTFHRVQLHRNTRNYRIVLGICRLIHQSFLPAEISGQRRFRDILRDETVMHRLFEAFVRNFATRHCAGATVSQMSIQWQASQADEQTTGLLPWMFTDVTISWPHRKLILDCKYYPEALAARQGHAAKFHSDHLYQLHAYLTNKSVEPGWENVEGMLLYPANGHHLYQVFTLHHRHRVAIATIDLQQKWPEIEENLITLLLSSS